MFIVGFGDAERGGVVFSLILHSELESKFHGGNAIYVKISENFSWGGYKRNT